MAKEKIESFSKTPSAELKTEIISEINSAIAQSLITKRKKKHSKNNVDSLDIYSEVNEAGSDGEVSIDELY
nr:hypothetical protein [Bacillus licheniformis]